MHDVRSKSPPWGYASRSNSRGLPDPPPPLGLDIDRCITWCARNCESSSPSTLRGSYGKELKAWFPKRQNNGQLGAENKILNYATFVLLDISSWLPKIHLTWTFPCVYLDISQFYKINILIRKFAREAQNFIHIWNYNRRRKLLARNFTHERKSKTCVSSTKCTIYWGKR